MSSTATQLAVNAQKRACKPVVVRGTWTLRAPIEFSLFWEKLRFGFPCFGVVCTSGNVCVTDCVVAELEKLGHRYRLALHLAKDPRIKRLKCLHAGTYADDCIVQRVTEVSSCLLTHAAAQLDVCCSPEVACKLEKHLGLMRTVVFRVRTQHKCYLVATNDKDLKRRIRKIPGVPIVYLKGRTFAVERLPEAITALPSARSAISKV